MRLAAALAALLLVGSCAGSPESALDGDAADPDARHRADGSNPGTDGAVRVAGTAPRATGGFNAVVVLEPDVAVELPPSSEPPVLDQSGMAFYPPVLLARVGEPVHFTNSEDVLHNVRVFESATREPAFNVATPLGGTYEHVFEHEGAYAVSCDVHPAMAATIIVVSTPHAVIADRDGRFAFDNVRPGSYTVRLRHSGRWTERPLEVSVDGAEIDLTATP